MSNNEYVIAFQRVSTESQDIEEQSKQLHKFILNEGYSPEQIITIGEQGASAIKEDEDYKRCIDELYNTLETKNVKCIYCWELSRIYRKKKVGDGLVEYLKEHKVNLKIMTPALYLLDPISNEINAGMELAIALFTTMAEQEMRLKRARWIRSKERNSRAGKSNGGNTKPFGYSIDKDGYFIINEEEASVILTCYNKYATGKYSLGKLGIEMRELGYEYINTSWLHRVLSATMYIGYQKTTHKDGTKKADRTYPRIVSDELYNNVQEVLKNNFSGDLLKQSKHHYYCVKLIRCTDCGRYFTGSHSSYRCTKVQRDRGDKTNSCNNRYGLSISLLDGLVWDIAKHYETEKLVEIENANKEELKKANVELKQKLKNIPTLIDKTKQKLDRAVERNIDGSLSEEKFKEIKEKILKEAKELENKQIEYNTQLEFNNNRIKEIEGVKIAFKKRANDSIDMLDDYPEVKKQELVHKYIKEIKAYKQDDNNITIDVKTIYGYLTCKIHPFNKRMMYETMDGYPILIEPVYRDRDDKMAYTLKDSVKWQQNGETITAIEKRRIHYREKWIQEVKNDDEFEFGMDILKGGRIIFLESLHQDEFVTT